MYVCMYVCTYVRVSLLVSASTLMDSMLRDAVLYRRQKAGLYESPELFSVGVMQDYVPWTSENEVRNNITEQVISCSGCRIFSKVLYFASLKCCLILD